MKFLMMLFFSSLPINIFEVYNANNLEICTMYKTPLERESISVSQHNNALTNFINEYI